MGIIFTTINTQMFTTLTAVSVVNKALNNLL